MDILRFSTAGSVDDGKSTLIGRLLYDCQAIHADQLESIKKTSKRRGENYTNLALLTDGLTSEREQGITIDVAYRYFATAKRKFIIADTPGHVQYTRNMVTGASTSNMALILVDARHGVIEQTRRHVFIYSLLNVNHVVLCINKMDMVNYSEEIFEKIRSEFELFSSKLSIADIQYVPISALYGDNVVSPSDNMKWYKGPTLLHIIENVHVSSDLNYQDCRFPIQYVIRPQKKEYHDYRGYSGRVAGGVFSPGNEVMVLPSGFTTTIEAIYDVDKPVKEAFPPMSVTMLFKDDLDISRGDMVVKPQNIPRIGQKIDIMVCWFSRESLKLGKKYLLMHTHQVVKCLIKEIHHTVDVNTLHREEKISPVVMNTLARITVQTTKSLFYDDYLRNRSTGSVIFIDMFTHETVGAGIIKSSMNLP